MSATILGNPPVKIHTDIDTISTVPITDFSRSLLSDSTSSSARETLGSIYGINADNYINLETAISSIGSTVTTLYINSSEVITNNITIPITLSVVVNSPGVIAVASGKTLTINGPFKANPYLIFSSTGTIVFGPSSVIEVYPQWWGGVSNTAIDQTLYIESAIATNLPVYITKGTWLCNITILDTVGTKITGSGFDCILKTYNNTTPIITITSLSVQVIGTQISNLTIDGNSLSEGIYMAATTPFVVHNSIIENIDFVYCTTSININSGTAAEEVFYNSFKNIRIFHIPDGVLGAFNNGIYSNGGVENSFTNVLILYTGSYSYAIVNYGTHNTFINVNTDGCIRSSGQNAAWFNTTVETIYSTVAPDFPVFRADGHGQTIVGLQIVNVDTAKCDRAIEIWGDGHFINKIRIYGTDYPTYSVVFNGTTSGTLLNVTGGHYSVYQGNSETLRRNWFIADAEECENSPVFLPKISWASSTPAGGGNTWAVGDYVRNSTPSVGQPKGWCCTVAGTPGTWVSEGNL